MANKKCKVEQKQTRGIRDDPNVISLISRFAIEFPKILSSFFVLDMTRWNEKLKPEGVDYVVPENGVISIRFAKNDVEKKVRIFYEK